MKINTIIFDVDGVLINSVPYHFKAWKKVFEEEGVKITFEDYLKKVNGLPRITGVKNILPGKSSEKIDRVAQRKQDLLLKMVREKSPKPLPGVVKFINVLKEKGYKVAAASSSKNCAFLLTQAGIVNLFDTIVSGHDFTLPKPHPEIFLTAAKRLGVHPKQCVVIEDAIFGIQAGKKGGMKTVGVLTSNDKLLKKAADLVVKSLKDYQKILDFISQ